VLREIYRKQSHFDVEELIQRMRQRGHRVSRATVYRTMGHLESSGLVRKLGLDNSHAHYEVTLGPAHHEHLVCERCGKIVEITDSIMEERLKQLLKKSGFSEKAYHTVEITGICMDCSDEEDSI
jgi:Fur family ferric uptake transcriptional regulator